MVNKQRLTRIVAALGKYRRRKAWLNFRCPFHHGDSLNFGVSISKGNYSCFACGVTGTLTELEGHLRTARTTRYHGDTGTGGGPDIAIPPINHTSPGFFKHLSDYADEQEQSAGVAGGPEVPREEYENQFWGRYAPLGTGNIIDSLCREYLDSRKIDYRKVIAGTLEDYPYYVVFPFLDHENRLTYWQGKAIDSRKPKTINPDESRWMTGKNKVLWGYEHIKKNSHVVLTEGVFDALSASNAIGVPATCLLGSSISYEQVQLLRVASSVLVLLDGDANKKAVQVATELVSAKVKTYVVIWPDSLYREDPNSLHPRQVRNLVSGAVPVTPTSTLRLLLECA